MACDEEYLIFLVLRRRLSDKSAVNKQQIRLALVNRALENVTKINPFYECDTTDND